MKRAQFRILYRQFLFRMVDFELLSPDARGDLSKLAGQFAALLIFLSLGLAMVGSGAGGSRLPRFAQWILEWSGVHFLIATTMLTVAIFAVLSWDTTFPDGREVQMLGPLPIAMRTLFLARVTAAGTALAIAVAALHSAAGLVWPLALNRGGVAGLVRLLAAYWVTMFAAGAFVFCCVLGIQGLASQCLPRRVFLRISSWLQLAVFGLAVCAYFLEPKLISPWQFASPWLAWSPSYWFLGLFEELNGSRLLEPLARRACIGFAAATGATVLAYTLAYGRTLRRIVEQPDIAPAVRGGSRLPRFGTAFETAVCQFCIRTILRSRQQRLIAAFYLGIGFAATILFPQWPAMREVVWNDGVSPAVLGSTILVMAVCVAGARIAFSLPTDLRANWVFRITPSPPGPECMAARRRALYAVSMVPVWVGSAAILSRIWPWRIAAAHLVILGLLGVIAAEAGLTGIQKIPFTCSYLPGKSNVHMTFLLCSYAVFTVMAKAAQLERRMFDDARGFAATVGILGALWIGLRWRNNAFARSPEGEIQFEEAEDPAIFAMDLHRDGVTVLPSPPGS